MTDNASSAPAPPDQTPPDQTRPGQDLPASYRDAVSELESILAEIEDQAVDVDVLADRVARAAALISWCRDRIVAARTAVEAVTAESPDRD